MSDQEQAIIFAGFWKRLLALIIDAITVSFIVLPFALIIGLISPNALLVEVPFELFTTTETLSQKPEIIEEHADGSTSVVEISIVKENVLGLFENYYSVKTTKSHNEIESTKTLISKDNELEITKTTSSDIEFYVLFIYWIVFESSVWQASLGKKILGIKVTTITGNRPTIFQAIARNLLKILSGITLFIGFMMAGWTSNKQALHDKISNMLVISEKA